jgi:hypothetical protein
VLIGEAARAPIFRTRLGATAWVALIDAMLPVPVAAYMPAPFSSPLAGNSTPFATITYIPKIDHPTPVLEVLAVVFHICRGTGALCSAFFVDGA